MYAHEEGDTEDATRYRNRRAKDEGRKRKTMDEHAEGSF